MKRYILTILLTLCTALTALAQTDALVVELNNGVADIFPVSETLRIVNQTEKDSIVVVDGTRNLASYARIDVKRIAFDKEALLTDSVERAALVALYNATDGDHWKNNTNWCSDKPLSEWYGLTVTAGHVTRMNLSDQNLTGEIPLCLGNLTKLESLNLFRNQLNGAIPSSLGNLTNLTSLSLAYNQLTGVIPPELGNLTKLTHLDFNNNYLTGEIPESFNNLTGLIKDRGNGRGLYFDIDTYDNNLSGKIPSLFYNSPAWYYEWPHLMYGNKLYNLEDIYIPAPSFHVKDIDGNILDSKEIYPQNKYTAIFVWRSNKPGSSPLFKEVKWVYDSYKDMGFDMIGQTTKESEQSIRDYMSENGITWRYMISSEDNMFDYPSSFISKGDCYPIGLSSQISLVDSNGRVIYTSAITSQLGPVFKSFIIEKLGLDKETLRIDSIERAALTALYNSTGGDSWKNNTNWCSDKPLSEWYGVSLINGSIAGTSNGRVYRIRLYNNNLSGTIPPELGNLTELRELSLYSNHLTGEIPSTIGNLINLTGLNLSNNQLTGIPPELGNLTNLTGLNLSNNQLTGIPPELGNLTNLTGLYLSNNQLTGIPPELGNLTNLTRLNLSNNQLTGIIPSTIGSLISLTELDMSGNLFEGIAPELANLTNLTELDLAGNQLDESIPSELGNLKQLSKLYLGGNQFNKIPSWFGELTNLTELRLSKNRLTSVIPPELGNLTNLIWLDLSMNHLTGEIPESFSNLKGLIRKTYDESQLYFALDTWNNNLSGKIPTLFQNSPEWYHEWVNIMYGNPLYNLEEVNIPAPPFHVKDIDGNILDSKEIYPKNKYTAIFYWATWCGFSNVLMPEVVRLYEKYKDYGFEIIGQTKDEPEQTIRDHIAAKGIQWKNMIVTKDNQFDYSSSFCGDACGYPANSTPMISLVDNSGRVVFTSIIQDRWTLAAFLKEKLGEGKSEVLYESTDFSADGKVATLQTASGGGKDIKVVIMGDGFSDRQIADGSYDAAMQKAKNALFTSEPFKSYKDKFTVKSVTAVSKNDAFTEESQTAFSGKFGEGTHIEGDNAKVFEYAQKAISTEDMDDAIIIVIMNSYKWAGTCWMYQPEKPNTWGSGATVAYVPTFDGTGGMFDYISFETLLTHEAVGHGFGKLGDEYVQHEEAIPAKEVESHKASEQLGWWKNTDFTSNPQEVKWSTFISDNRYASEGIGVYEGGLTYRSDVWRPSEKSIMSSDDTEFNAPSRMAIWYRLNKLTQGENWEGTYEDFVAFDKSRPSARTVNRSQAKTENMSEPIRLAPPVVKNITWRMEK